MDVQSDLIVGEMNELTLRNDRVIPKEVPDKASPSPDRIDLEGFDLLAEVDPNSGVDHHREPRQLESAVVFSAIESAEIIAEALASAAEAAPVVHEAMAAGAALPAEATTTTGIVSDTTLLANTVPLAVLPATAGVVVGHERAEGPPQQGGDPHPPRQSTSLDAEGDLSNRRPHMSEAPRRLKPRGQDQPLLAQKFGDNSIVTTLVSTENIYSLRTNSTAIPNFISQMTAEVRNMPDNFVEADSQYFIRSRIVPIETQNSTSAGADVRALVFDMHEAPLAPAHSSYITVAWQKEISKGYVLPSDLVPYMNGPTLSAKYTADMLKRRLHPVPLPVLTDAAPSIEEQLIFYDNRAMYAKLIHFALAQEIATAQATQITAEAWPAAQSVHFVNLDDPNITATQLSAPIARGDFVFIEHDGWDMSDLLVTHWLASPGFRTDGADGHTTAYAHYISWPEIPVTVLRHGAAPGRPQEALVPPSSIYAFARKLARLRHEQADLAAGIYIAMELSGVRYIAHNDHFYGVTSNHNTGEILLPGPQDYNYMIRVAKLFPKDTEVYGPEIRAFLESTATDRVRTTCVYNACLSAFTTTLLFSLSITTQDVYFWGLGQNPQSTVNTQLARGICVPIPKTGKECAPICVPRAAIKQYLGLVCMTGLMPAATWNGEFGRRPNIQESFRGMDADCAIRWQTVLGIDCLLLERPREWCILGPHTAISLGAELVVNASDPDVRGVCTQEGDATYQNQAMSNHPYLFIPYGNQLINAIHQHLALPRPAVHYQPITTVRGKAGRWGYTRNYPAVHYIPDLHIFEPCVFNTYDFRANQIRAPVMVDQDLDQTQRLRLAGWKGNEIDMVGFALRQDPGAVFEPLEPAPIMEFASLGMFDDDPPVQPSAGTSRADEPALN